MSVKAILKGLFAAPPETGVAEHRSYLVHRNYRYLKVALLLCGLSIAAYMIDDPSQVPSGNTWLGYTLGTIGALLIGWLAWFGVRKRRFNQGRGQAQAWVSAHVYLGLSLLVVATLHTGFQFGWNLHTLAYALMCLVIASGVYGIFVYGTLPRRITANRRQAGFRDMLEEVARLDESALVMADRIDPETHAIVARSVGNSRIGGSAWEQLSGNYRQANDRAVLEKFFSLKQTQLASQPQATERAGNVGGGGRRQATISFVANQIFDAGRDPRGEALQKLLQSIAQRKELVARINQDITLRARLNVWLFLHVPLTVGLLVALAGHILSTFFYW
jgi:hypothetical protein